MESRKRAAPVIVALVLVLALPAGASATTAYLVEANGSFPSNLDALVAGAGGTLVRVQGDIGVAEATSNDPGFAARLAGNAGIQAVTPDVLVQWAPTPDSVAGMADGPSSSSSPPNPSAAAFFGCQWNLRQIDAPGAWAQGQFGSPAGKVAVLDTGVDPTHIDLVGRVDTADSVSMLTPGSSPCGAGDETQFFDFFFHGTFVSSLITSNGIGMASVAPGTQVVGVKVLNCHGSGSFGDVIAGIDYAASLPSVNVINMSLGAVFAKTQNGRLLGALAKAVNFANGRGKLVVAASGNNGLDLDHIGNVTEVPGESGATIAIYATTITQGLASYSNFGNATWVGAPGGDLPNPVAALPGCPVAHASQSLVLGACSSFSLVFACGAHHSYLLGDGTSFATPLVSGVAALVSGEGGGGVNPGQLKATLAQTADDIGDPNLFSHGRVNASEAVSH
jgi:lantibiotic leader peptide-processing serine protease